MLKFVPPIACVVALAACTGNPPPVAQPVGPVLQPEAVAPPPVSDPDPAPPPVRSWHVVPRAEAAQRTFDPPQSDRQSDPPHFRPIDPSGSDDCVGWWRLCHLWSGS